MEQLICSGLRNKYNKAIYCHLVYLTYTQSTSYISYDRLDELQAGIKISGRNINNLKYMDDTTLMAESEGKLTSLLIRVKEESENAGLKLNIKKTKIMASSPITSWQTEGEKVEAVTDFLSWGSKITVDGTSTHEIRRPLLLGRKAMANLDSVLKSKDITLLTKVHIGKAMILPVVIYACESWTIKKVVAMVQSLSHVLLLRPHEL